MSSKVKELLDLGRKRLAEKDKQSELTKTHQYRVGSSGCILPSGVAIGVCPRKALARYFGIYIDVEEEKVNMFAGGHANEDVWAKELLAGLEDSDFILKREEELGLEGRSPDGILITGRPDLVICSKEEGNPPLVGIELKAVSSLWVAIDTKVNKKPKVGHLVQAAHYMNMLDVPYELWYTNRVNLSIPEWVVRKGMIPRGESWLGHSAKGDPTAILPFDQGFFLDWNEDGTLVFASVDDPSRFTATNITKGGLAKFYELMDKAIEKKALPNRPADLDWTGEKQRWSMCDPKYCAFSSVCDRAEREFDSWLAEARKV